MLNCALPSRNFAVLEKEESKPFNEKKGRAVLYYRQYIAAVSRAAL